jgi:ATP/ADP translocase
MKKFLPFIFTALFLVTAEYGMTRPASQSLLITFFSAKMIPYLWIATIPLNFFVIAFYNRYLSKIGPVAMLTAIAGATIVINGVTPYLSKTFPHWILFQYAWKDIYVLLMLKQVWSLIHTTVPGNRAKFYYGILYGTGTAGSVLGSCLPGWFATKLGSEQLFYFTIPLYLLLILSYRAAATNSNFVPAELKNTEGKGSFSLIFQSPYLLIVLILGMMMQMVVGLTEYQFNTHLELNILEKDLRTEYFGQMISYLNLLSGFFQVIGSFLMVHLLGVQRSHILIPLLILFTISSLTAIPSFALISFAFVFIKAIDFSLFGIIREMLYIPMKLEEKFRAKAIMDVFAHRTSKALVSLCILGIQFSSLNVLPYVTISTIALLIVWVVIAWGLLRKHYPEKIEN